jgi:hypothetical protein
MVVAVAVLTLTLLQVLTEAQGEEEEPYKLPA